MTKVDKSTLMAFMYGELGPEERKNVENQLKEKLKKK